MFPAPEWEVVFFIPTVLAWEKWSLKLTETLSTEKLPIE